jgi:hypothetical protein
VSLPSAVGDPARVSDDASVPLSRREARVWYSTIQGDPKYTTVAEPYPSSSPVS